MSETKQIVRIEHPYDGMGIWHSKNDKGHRIYPNLSFVEKFISTHNNFPTPDNDGLIMYQDSFCAFKSIDQMNRWINKNWWPEIFAQGFVVFLIEVSNWQEGEYQFLFKKKDIVNKIDISEQFK